MKQEVYAEAVKISIKIEHLYKVQREIVGKSRHRLSYVNYDDRAGGADSTPCPDCIMAYISDILDKHDTMIRKEIEEEIEKLKNRIEEL